MSLPPWLIELAQHRVTGRLITAFVLSALVWLIARALRATLTNRIQDTSARYRSRKTVNAVASVLVLLILATAFSDKLGGLALSLGVVGAGVAFALQEVIASVAGRVAIAFVRFYDVGDRVQLGGIKGDVIDIGVLRTTLMELGSWVDSDNYTGRIVRVANSFVFKEPVFNYSADFGFLWDEIKVPVRYGSPLAETKQLLQRAVTDIAGVHVGPAQAEWAQMTRAYRIEDARVTPMVTLIANDNWLEYTVRFVVPYTQRRGVKDALFERIVTDIEQTGGRIQLGSATYELVAAPTLRVSASVEPKAT